MRATQHVLDAQLVHVEAGEGESRGRLEPHRAGDVRPARAGAAQDGEPLLQREAVVSARLHEQHVTRRDRAHRVADLTEVRGSVVVHRPRVECGGGAAREQQHEHELGLPINVPGVSAAEQRPDAAGKVRRILVLERKMVQSATPVIVTAAGQADQAGRMGTTVLISRTRASSSHVSS